MYFLKAYKKKFLSKLTFFSTGSIYLIFLIVVLSCKVQSNKDFKPDQYGYVAETKFHKLIKDRQYQLVGGFDTVQKKPLLMYAKVVKNNKWGFIDLNCNEVIPAVYESVSRFRENGLTVVYKNEKAGIIDLHGKVIIKTVYKKVIYNYNKNLVTIKSDHGWGVLKISGDTIIMPNCDSISVFSFGLIGVLNKQKWGLFDSTGKEIIKPIYEDIGYLGEGLLKVQLKEKWGCINALGKQILNPIYDFINPFYEGMAVVKYKGKCGFINTYGNEVIKPKYDWLEGFRFGRAGFEMQSNPNTIVYGYIDKTGKEIINSLPLLPTSNHENENFILISDTSGGYFLFNSNGQKVRHLDIQNIDPYYEDIAVGFNYLKKIRPRTKKWGAIDRNGNILIEFIYDEMDNFRHGMATVKNDNKWGMIDTKGNIVVPIIYEDLGSFKDGLIGFKKSFENYWGFMDINSNVIIEPKHGRYSYFEGGLNTKIEDFIADDGVTCHVIDKYGNAYEIYYNKAGEFEY